MLKIKRVRANLLKLILVFSLILTFVFGCFKSYIETSAVFEGVKVSISSDTYIVPVAELRTTKTYPDVIAIENEYVKVSIVPNRGRLIFDYLFKPTGSNKLYTNTKPRPLKTPDGYIVEFGGYYLSLPWNPRARQPYDLEYEVLKDGTDVAELYLWAEDPINHAFMEAWVSVKQHSSIVRTKVRISNRTEKDIVFEFGDCAVISLGGEVTANSAFVVPASEVIIGQSKDSWMGTEGDVVSWPQVWVDCGNFAHFGSFSTEVEKMSAPFAGMINYDTGDALVKLWEPADFFDGLRIWSWGEDYSDVKGAAPTANFENYKETISLSPGESIDFFTYLYALKDMRNIIMANTAFAGWVATDRQFYRIDADKPITIQSQLGSTEDYKNINLTVSLTDSDDNILKQVINEQVSGICPANPYNGAWIIKFEDIMVEPGEYAFKLELLDTQGKLIFTVESLPITIE